MSYTVRPGIPSRSYGVRSRPTIARPYYGQPVAATPAAGLAVGAGAGALGGALGAIGGTLGCLLCLAAIGALGLFSCVIAITAYTKQFLNAFQTVTQTNGVVQQSSICLLLLLTSLFYVMVCRLQRR